MNVTPQGLMSNPLVAQPASPLLFQPQSSLPRMYQSPSSSISLQSQWHTNNNIDNNDNNNIILNTNNNNLYNSCQLPLQMSQYYNVFPEVPSTRTSWTFPNGCVTSSIVRFTGSPIPSYPVGSITHVGDYKANGALPTKRKSLVPDNEEQPSKIFITEEKMAAKMNEMHISNEFVTHHNENFSDVDINDMDDELQKTVNDNSNPQLVLCDELKNISKDLENIIPEPLIPMEKPTTALVLWRPPMSYLNVVKIPSEEKYPQRSSVIITDITDRPDLDNNNINSVNLNTFDSSIVEHSQDEMEVMEI